MAGKVKTIYRVGVVVMSSTNIIDDGVHMVVLVTATSTKGARNRVHRLCPTAAITEGPTKCEIDSLYEIVNAEILK